MEPTTDLTAMLLTWLIWLSGPASGVVASWLQSGLIRQFPAPAEPPAAAWKRTVYTWIHAPRYKLYVAMLLSAIVAGVASGLIAFITALSSGDGVSAAVSAGIAMVLGVVFNQLVYRRGLSKQVWNER